MFGFIKKIKLLTKVNRVFNKIKKHFDGDKAAKYKEIKACFDRLKKAVPEIAEDIDAIKTLIANEF